jgi:P pilus assembly chaperone PapD
MIYKKIFFPLLLAFLFVFPAQARIDIVPQKILIENRERNGELTVLNLMNVPGTFRLKIENFQQDENGVYQDIKKPLHSNFDPQKIVRFSPRQFIIEPGGRQKIRLSLRKPGDLPEGEYRFHIKAIRVIHDEDRRSANSSAVNITANIGVTIPVVVRHGNISATASISDTKLVRAVHSRTEKPELHLNIARTGNSSTLGMLEVLWQPAGQKARRIGRITNMNIFTDINKRFVQMPLYEMPSGKGSLSIRYVDTINKGQVFDEVTMQL